MLGKSFSLGVIFRAFSFGGMAPLCDSGAGVRTGEPEAVSSPRCPGSDLGTGDLGRALPLSLAA
jgi:hypothetical protein